MLAAHPRYRLLHNIATWDIENGVKLLDGSFIKEGPIRLDVSWDRFEAFVLVTETMLLNKVTRLVLTLAHEYAQKERRFHQTRSGHTTFRSFRARSLIRHSQCISGYMAESCSALSKPNWYRGRSAFHLGNVIIAEIANWLEDHDQVNLGKMMMSEHFAFRPMTDSILSSCRNKRRYPLPLTLLDCAEVIGIQPWNHGSPQRVWVDASLGETETHPTKRFTVFFSLSMLCDRVGNFVYFLLDDQSGMSLDRFNSKMVNKLLEKKLGTRATRHRGVGISDRTVLIDCLRYLVFGWLYAHREMEERLYFVFDPYRVPVPRRGTVTIKQRDDTPPPEPVSVAEKFGPLFKIEEEGKEE